MQSDSSWFKNYGGPKAIYQTTTGFECSITQTFWSVEGTTERTLAFTADTLIGAFAGLRQLAIHSAYEQYCQDMNTLGFPVIDT